MRLLFLSNGHGEDLIGSRLAAALQPELPGVELTAFPLVGAGAAWEDAGFRVAGARRELPSGGLTLHSFSNLSSDLRAGLLGSIAGQFRDLRRSHPDAVVVIGDVWALFLSLFTRVPAERRFVLQPLVSLDRPAPLTGPHRLFMERITLPERLLQRRCTHRVWTRDAATAAELRRLGVAQAGFAGSFLEPAAVPPPEGRTGRPAVLLLPGSRAWAGRSLEVMLETALLLPGAEFRVAWVAHEPPAPAGWQPVAGNPWLITRDGVTVEVARNAFRSMLAVSDAVLGTSGTAVEEAAASGRPCLSFPLPGSHSAAFLRNQERILRGALHVCGEADPPLLAATLRRLLEEPGPKAAAAAAGARLAAEAGGTRRIALELAALLSPQRPR